MRYEYKITKELPAVFENNIIYLGPAEKLSTL